MKIGELAAAAGTPVETVRYYEKQQLLPAPARSGGNFRVYGREQIERLRFIRHCRGLDMSLDEVRALLRFKDAPASDCSDVNRLLDEHIGHVATRIRELQALQKQLKALRSECRVAQDAGHCGILSGLTQAAGDAASTTQRPHPPRQRHLAAVHSSAPASTRRRR